ncbi:MAG TPA: hypothetical protein VGL66_00285 [Caulobacteraceae bacterium]|jgi:hypothetical protein
MTRFSSRLFAASALAAATVLTLAAPACASDTITPTPPAAAFAPTPVSPQADMLGQHIVAVSFDHLSDMKPLWTMGMAIATAQMKAAAEKHGGVAVVAWDRFGPWYGYFIDASTEEFHDDRARYEQILGHWLAEKYTVEELQALSDLFDSPAAQEFSTQLQGAIGSLSAKTTPKMTWSPKAQAAIDRFKSSPGGKGFIARTEAMSKDTAGDAGKMIAATKGGAASKDADAKALQDMLERDPQTTSMFMDLVATWMPGTMRRWGEKAEAAEKARLAAIAAGAPPPSPSH